VGGLGQVLSPLWCGLMAFAHTARGYRACIPSVEGIATAAKPAWISDTHWCDQFVSPKCLETNLKIDLRLVRAGQKRNQKIETKLQRIIKS